MSDPMPPEAINDIAARLKAVDDFNPLPWTSKYDSFGVEINFGPTFQVEDANGDLVFATDSIQDLADLLRFAPTDLRRLLDENARLNAELAEFANTITAPAKQLAEIGAMVGYPDPPGIADAVRAELDRVIREAAADKAKLAAENARYLQIINEITADNAGLTASLDAVAGVVPQLRQVFGDGDVRVDTVAKVLAEVLEAAPEMPRPPAEEAPTEYRCPNCYRWALWTDGVVDGDDEGVEEFWCQTCGSQTPIENMDSRPQEARGDTDTSPAGSGRGTGVTEAQNSQQAFGEEA